MNNTLDFNRLQKVIRFDAINYSQRFLKIMIIIIVSVLFGGWLIGTTQKVNINGDQRLSYLLICFLLTTIFAPEKLYGNANDSRNGIRFAMLPASALEKTISMVLYCAIVTPILTGIIGLLTDGVLGLLPFGAFKGSFFASQIGKQSSLIADFFLQVFFYSCIFIFGTVLFKKRQILKTIASLIALVVLLICIATPAIFSQYGEKVVVMISDTFSLSNGTTEVLSLITHYLFLAVLLFGIYRRIKKQKY
ncbi:MAG: hypothetical protein ACTTKO_00990 [Candidatus Limimorpha sp.]